MTVSVETLVGRNEPRVGFDFDALEPAPADQKPWDDVEARELISRLVNFIRAGVVKERAGKPGHLHAVGLRLVVFLELLASSGQSLTELAKRYGVTRAAMSAAGIRLADGLRIHATWQRSEDARAKYWLRARGVWRKRWVCDAKTERRKLTLARRLAASKKAKPAGRRRRKNAQRWCGEAFRVLRQGDKAQVGRSAMTF